MKKSTNHHMHEYFVLINPPNRINWDVEDIEFEFEEHSGKKLNHDIEPHIALANFVQRHEREEKVIQSLQDIASRLNPFDISLAGFDFYDKKNRLSIDIKNKRAVKVLHDSLLSQLPLKDVPVDRSADTFYPSMTISEKLSDSDYRDVYHELSKKNYTNYFRVEYLTVLKRTAKNQSWQYFTEIPLNEVA